MAYSFSGLSTYDINSGQYACPYAFYLGRIREIPTVPTGPLLLGSGCHSVIETATRYQNPALIPPLAEAVASANNLDADEVTQLCSADEVIKAAQQGGIVEEYFEMPANPANPFSPTIRGFIDYHIVVNNRVILIDWKTNQAMYGPTDTPQLALYCAYLSQKYGLPVEAYLCFLRFNKTVGHEYSHAEIQEVCEWAETISCEIDANKQRIQMGENPEDVFPKQMGSKACQYCGYQNICMAGEAVIPLAITSVSDAVQTAKGVLLLEEQTKIHKDNLKKFVSSNGDVDTDGIKISMDKSEYLFFDTNARINTIQKILSDGLPIDSILKIGSDAQAELIKKYGWSETAFINLGAVKCSKTTLKLGVSNG